MSSRGPSLSGHPNTEIVELRVYLGPMTLLVEGTKIVEWNAASRVIVHRSTTPGGEPCVRLMQLGADATYEVVFREHAIAVVPTLVGA